MADNWKAGAKQQFANFRDPGMLREIKVEEWGVSVYYWPKMSMYERRAVVNAYRQAENGDVLSSHVENLIARARDEHGRNLFSDRERDDLLTRYDPDVIARVSEAMISEAPEDAEKN